MDGAFDVAVRNARMRQDAANEDPRIQEQQAIEDLDFTELVTRQGRFLFRIALGLLRNQQDAEDAVQETLLKLYRTGAWRNMENERGFLARSVWRAGLDRIAARPPRADDVAEFNLTAPGASPEQQVADHVERTLLRRLIDALPEDLRQPLILSAIDGMTSRQVAETIGVPEGTVRTRLMRARTELKRRFEARTGKETQS